MLQIRGLSYTVVGVAPQSFTGVIPMLAPELWMTVSQNEEVEPAGINDNVPSPVVGRGSNAAAVDGCL